jgi:O-antigen/teichoic acid export membrane protein
MSLQLLGKNTTIYAVGTIILRAGAFLLIPIYTNYLSIEEYGILASLFITIEVLVILMNSGMKNSFIRFFKESENENKTGQLIGTSLFVNIVSGVIVASICIIFLLPYIKNILHIQNLNYLIELACGAALMESLYFLMISYYRAKNKANKFLYFSILTFIILLSLNYIFLVILNEGIQGVIFARIISYGITLLIILILVNYKIGIRISFSLLSKLLKFGFPLIFSVSGEKIIYLGMIYLLSFYSGLKDVAVFALAFKFTSILGMIIILPIQLSLQPYIFANLDQKNIKENMTSIFTYFVFSMSFASLAVIIFSKFIIPIVSPPNYWEASQLVILLIPAFVIRSFKVYGEVFLDITKKTYLTGIIVGLIGISSLLVNYIFIINWGLTGLIGSFNILNFVLSGLLFSFGFSVYKIRIDWKRIKIIFIWFLVFIITAYYSIDKGSLIFYLSTSFVGILFIFYIFIFKFITEKERQSLSNILSTINLKVSI